MQSDESRQTGDIGALNYIMGLVQGTEVASSSTVTPSGSQPEVSEHQQDGAKEKSTDRTARKERETLVLEGARLCASLAQITALFEEANSQGSSRTFQTISSHPTLFRTGCVVTRTRSFFAAHLVGIDLPHDLERNFRGGTPPCERQS